MSTEMMATERDEKTQAVLVAALAKLPRHERILHLRALNDMSQQDLADLLGNKRGTVSTWEQPAGSTDNKSGRCAEPSKRMRVKMSYIFGVPAHVFTDDWGAQPNVPYWRVGGEKPENPKPARAAERQATPPAPARVSGVRRI